MTKRIFSQSERFALYLAADGKCQSCGAKLSEAFHADHVHPYSKGGDTDVINGQALCPACNLKKSNSIGGNVSMESPSVNLRTWQMEEQEKFEQFADKWFVLVATPGAGKTTAMLNNAYYMLKSGRCNLIVVVVPSTTLKYQWKKAARRDFGLNLRASFEGYVTDDFDGVIVTYQQLSGSVGRDAIRALHRGHQVFSVFDEPHHMAEGKSWGTFADHALGPSVGGVLGTGTPFRSDDYAIPFVKYHPETRTLIPHHEYLYADGLIDQVVRGLYFRKIDTEASWYSYTDEIVTATFEDDLDERQASERLNTVIAADSQFVHDVLKQAYAELLNLRLMEQPDAKMLIVCKNTWHAESVAKRFEEINNIKPVLVTSDEEHGNREDIDSFGVSADPVIIAVDMISEGVDIPSLRSLVYLTNKVAPLYFLQAIGRVVRAQKGMELANGYVYLPSDSRLLKMAHEFKLRRNHVLDAIGRSPSTQSGEKLPKEVKQPSLYQPIDATFIDAGGIYDGMEYSPGFIAETSAWIKQHGLRIAVEEGCKIRTLSLMAQATTIPTPQTVSGPDPEDRLDTLSKQSQRHAFHLAQILGVNVQEIHSRWVYDKGGKWQKQEDVAGMERKVRWLVSEIKRLERGTS